MPQSYHKHLYLSKIVILLVLTNFWCVSTTSTKAATTADWGDVVDIHYYRYTNAQYSGTPAEDNTLDYVYLTTGQDVPPEIETLFPDANAGLILGFKEGIIGLAENQDRKFQTDDVYDGEGYLYFHITLVKIWYDASGETPSSTTTTTTTTRRNPGGLDTLAILGGGAVIVLTSVLIWGYITQNRRRRALSGDSSSVSTREQSLKQKKTQLKELRELADSRRISDASKDDSTTERKFRRRR
jgi:hypothetical protein